ncbi:hypothetical protein [uncultured Amnibacterium sp.]|uniref:hypothetical protein n=1 Tax=uncultured Amnibacterium sp. TaxID=1631851 RepID=UPI0035C977E8
MSTVALLPGDAFRVPLIAEFLTDVQQVARQREHRTMTDSTALGAAFLTPDERGSIAGRLAAER